MYKASEKECGQALLKEPAVIATPLIVPYPGGRPSVLLQVPRDIPRKCNSVGSNLARALGPIIVWLMTCNTFSKILSPKA